MRKVTFEEEWAASELPTEVVRAIDNAVAGASEVEAAIFLKEQIGLWEALTMRPDSPGYAEAAIELLRRRLDGARETLRDTIAVAKIRIALATGALEAT